jgi:HEPN domain-containing protein
MSASEREDALVWLGYALGDLRTAQAGDRDPLPPRIVAFHAQQAAEKALKAALVLAGADPQRTHELEDLRSTLPAGWRCKASPPDLTRLSRFAVNARYPDSLEPVTAIMAATAVRQATAVVRRVGEDFERRGVSIEGLQPR